MDATGDIHIAIVGFSCRFPGDATSSETLWEMLLKGDSAWSEFPSDRVNINGYFHPNAGRNGSVPFRGAHFLKQDVAAFDSSFFHIPADEAKSMDPQHRMLLEVTTEALDNAGIDRKSLRKSDTGVWIGSFVKDYEQICLRDPDDAPIYGATGNGTGIMSNRISHFLDLNGPSMTIDTGCSASLVSVHNACQSLRTQEAAVALAGGAGLILSPDTMMPMASLGFLSPDGKCFTFDARANGYGRGEGVGMVVLKRLKDAIRNNDNIRAVIRGTRVNQDGRTPGITLPSSEAQTRNIQALYERCGLDPEKTAFVECHGTGTQAGDSRELLAISNSLCGTRTPYNPVYVGSIKTNIGHLEGGAGTAGLIKVIMMLENGFIPMHINFEAPGSPSINFIDLKVKVPTENTQWPVSGLRRASVNSFGFGGTNAHMIVDDSAHYLEERGLCAHHNTVIFSDIKDPSVSHGNLRESIDAVKARMRELNRRAAGLQVPHWDDTSQLFVFSAHDQSALMRVLKGQEKYLLKKKEASNSKGFMENLAYTLGCRRTKMQWRCAIAAKSSSELATKLQNAQQSTLTRASEDRQARIAFVFAGQGAQWFAMGRELMGFDIYLESILAASRFLSDNLGSKFSLLAELLRDKDSSRINDPEISQPATTAVQVALVDFLVRFCGIMPSSVVGHSSGEIAAAYAGGMISRETAWELAYRRGQCVQHLSTPSSEASVKGKMLAVGLSDLEASEYIFRTGNSNRVVVACINSPTSVTLSGDSDAILEIQKLMEIDGVFNRLLKVNIAYHSPHMRRCDYQYLESITHLEPREPTTTRAQHPHAKGKLLSTDHLSLDNAKFVPISKEEAPVMYSSVTGKPVDWHKLGSTYWIINLVSPVRFYDAMAEMMRRKDGRKPDIILELGPHASLRGPINQIMETISHNGGRQPQYLAMLDRNSNTATTTLQTIGYLWCRAQVDMCWLVMRNIQLHRPKLIVDLPGYPWNHDVRYWHESHLSRANRLPLFGRYDLIGRPSTESTPFQPRWRGFLRLGENPWIGQHQVQNTIIYPAAGMTAMVIEGARQLTSEPIAGIEISQFRIEKAMIVPPTERGLEYSLSMSRQEPTKRHIARKSSYPLYGAKASIGYEFHIYSKPLDGPWQQHGNGTVTIHPEAESSQEAKEVDPKSKRYLRLYQRMKSACDDLVLPHQLYETLDVIGMNYGPLFQNITSLCKSDEGCTFAVRVPDTKSTMPAEFEYPHIIHPTTLDSIFQTALCLGGDSMVPSYIGNIYVSLRPGALCEAGKELVGYAQAESQGYRRANVTFVASDRSWPDSQCESTQRPLVIVKDMGFTVLSTSHDNAHNAPGGFLPSHHNLCSEFVWEDAPGHLATLISDHAEVKLPGGIFLLVPQDIGPELCRLCDVLSKKLQCDCLTLESIGDGNGLPQYCISLLEVPRGRHVLWNWSDQEFSAFRTLVNSTSGVLWLTQGAQIDVTNPKSSLFQSLARTIHSESPQKTLVTVDIDDHTDLTAIETVKMIVSWALNSFNKADSESPPETELVERGGSLLVPRLVPMESLNKLVERGHIPLPPRVQPINKHPKRALKINFGEIGKPESLYWDDDPEVSSPLPVDHVSIKVISAGLSTWDIDIVMGLSQGHSLGTDAYGIITSVGAQVQGFAVGDRVIAIARGSLSIYTRCHHSLVQKVADDIDDPSIVLMPTSFAVADYGLCTLASLTEGQTVLVHAGAGTIGQSAIRMAKYIGAKVFTTVANDTQRQVLESQFGFTEEWILDGNSSSVVDSIMRLTHNEGVNVIFDPTADNYEINRHSVTNCGHVVAFTKDDTLDGQSVDFTGKTFAYTVLDLRHLIKKQPWRLGEAFKFICSTGFKGWIPPHCPATKEYDFSELPKAINDLAGNSQCGLAYCVATEAAQVPIVPRRDDPVRKHLHQDGTYVLAGQGGLAMHIAKVLVANRAKNIALLSRSGTSSEASQAAIAYLLKRGAEVRVIKVDICDADALRSAAREIQETMPPIKGIFQCAAALHDAVFDTMSHAEWQAAVRPKTVGSWNLYEAFPKDMDFFIFLSSSSGIIGNRGQANYAAGNAFQDALARYIHHTGTMRAVSIDLGPVLGAGMLAEDPRTLDKLKASGFLGIRLQDFALVMERAVAGRYYDAAGDGEEQHMPAQVVVGVGTGGLLRQNRPADPYWSRKALFSRLNRVDLPDDVHDDDDVTDGGGGQRQASVKAQLSRACGAEEARAIVAAGLCAILAKGIGMQPDDVDEAKAPNDYGVDSLVAVAVRSWVFTECGVDVSVFEVLSNTSISDFSASIVKRGDLGTAK